MLLAVTPGSLATYIRCQDLYIPITAEAQNKDLKDYPKTPFTPESLQKFISDAEEAPDILVKGNFHISARYCAALADVPSRKTVLQVLVHGGGFDKEYWTGPSTTGTAGPGSPETAQESWVYYAAQQGYATLAVDRLCAGLSTRPNSLTHCQLPLEAEVLHRIIKMARSGKISNVPISFDKIVYVGHSYGSRIGDYLTANYPDSINHLQHTGFSKTLLNSVKNAVVKSEFNDANEVLPYRFGVKDPGYLVASDKRGFLPFCYVGDYSKTVSDFQWTQRDTITIGEIASALLGQTHSPNYKGDVFVMNGDQDVVCCKSPKSGQCDTFTYSNAVNNSYPAARRFQQNTVTDTGHCIMSHRTSKYAVKLAHGYMASAGL